jgi:hypothetical protein
MGASLGVILLPGGPILHQDHAPFAVGGIDSTHTTRLPALANKHGRDGQHQHSTPGGSSRRLLRPRVRGLTPERPPGLRWRRGRVPYLHFSALRNRHVHHGRVLPVPPAPRLCVLHFPHHVHAVDDPAEDDVLPVQMRGGGRGDEELAAVRVGPAVLPSLSLRLVLGTWAHTAMDSSPGSLWLSLKFSSSNLRPWMLADPVPSPFTKSPPCSMKPLIFKPVSGCAEDGAPASNVLRCGETCNPCSRLAFGGALVCIHQCTAV